jgi:hypothetical protein
MHKAAAAEKYWKLFTLSKKHAYAAPENQRVLEESIVNVATKNPKWITLITQVIVLMCVVLLASKLI